MKSVTYFVHLFGNEGQVLPIGKCYYLMVFDIEVPAQSGQETVGINLSEQFDKTY